MESDLSLNDVAAAQWCPDRRFYDLLIEKLLANGTDESLLAGFSFQGRHTSRASTSEFPLGKTARDLYEEATGSRLVTWSQAIRWVEEQGRHEEAVLFNQLYTFAWVRPYVPTPLHVRFNPNAVRLEAHDNLYDLADVAKLLQPVRQHLPMTD